MIHSRIQTRITEFCNLNNKKVQNKYKYNNNLHTMIWKLFRQSNNRWLILRPNHLRLLKHKRKINNRPHLWKNSASRTSLTWRSVTQRDSFLIIRIHWINQTQSKDHRFQTIVLIREGRIRVIRQKLLSLHWSMIKHQVATIRYKFQASLVSKNLMIVWIQHKA